MLEGSRVQETLAAGIQEPQSISEIVSEAEQQDEVVLADMVALVVRVTGQRLHRDSSSQILEHITL